MRNKSKRERNTRYNNERMRKETAGLQNGTTNNRQKSMDT